MKKILSIQLIQPFVISIYLLILIFSYRKNFVLILEFLKSFFPLIVIFFLLAVHVSTEIYLGWDAKYFYYIKSLFFYYLALYKSFFLNIRKT